MRQEERAPVDVLLVGYFPQNGAVAELFATLASSMSEVCRVAVLGPEHVALDPDAELVDLRFPYSSRRPDRALIGRGWTQHRAASRLRPRSTLFFTQHPINALVAPMFRHSRRAMWWHEPESRGQASVLRSVVYGTHDRLMTWQMDQFIVASPAVRDAVPAHLQERTAVVPFPRPDGFETASNRFDDAPTDLFFFGKLEKYKGLDVLGGALEQLHGRGVNPSLRVLGAGDLVTAAPGLEALRVRPEFSIEHVAEYASAQDVVSGLRSSSVCVLPYLSAAGSSTIAIAGASDTCLLASSAGSFGDFLHHDRTALLHDAGDSAQLADQIERALADGALRTRLATQLTSEADELFGRASVSHGLVTALLPNS